MSRLIYGITLNILLSASVLLKAFFSKKNDANRLEFTLIERLNSVWWGEIQGLLLYKIHNAWSYFIKELFSVVLTSVVPSTFSKNILIQITFERFEK